MQADTAISRPAQHGERNHFRPVIQNDGFWIAARGGDCVQGACHPHAREREVSLERQVLARAIVTDDEDTISPIAPESIVNEVQRPSLIRSHRRFVDRAAPQGELASHTLTHLKCCVPIDPLDAFVVVDKASATSQDDEAPLSVSPVFTGSSRSASCATVHRIGDATHNGTACD